MPFDVTSSLRGVLVTLSLVVDGGGTVIDRLSSKRIHLGIRHINQNGLRPNARAAFVHLVAALIHEEEHDAPDGCEGERC